MGLLHGNRYPRRLAGEIPFPPKSHPEACAFSPDGLYIVTGSADGFIEVWDFETCKFPKALTYQLEDKLMLHNDAILSLCFSRDSAMLASASAVRELLHNTSLATGDWNVMHFPLKAVDVAVACASKLSLFS